MSNANTPKALALAYTGITRLKWDDLGSYLTVVNSEDSSHDTHTPSADQDHNIHFRIHALTQHGSCVDGCPPTTLCVSSSDYFKSEDGHVRLCRADGLRFYSGLKIRKYRPAASDGVFLEFDVSSNPTPNQPVPYYVRVSRDSYAR